MKHKNISFLGDLIIISVIVFFVFLFMWQSKQNTVDEIIEINKEHNISNSLLTPSNPNDYILKLSKINNKEITSILIDFTELIEDTAYVEKSLYRASIVREECISRDLKLKINSIYLKLDKLINDFEKINVKKYDKLNISNYITFLQNLKIKYDNYKIETDKITICK